MNMLTHVLNSLLGSMPHKKKEGIMEFANPLFEKAKEVEMTEDLIDSLLALSDSE